MATSVPVCKYDYHGHCKFGDTCRNQHVDEICERDLCDIKSCIQRRPKECRYYRDYQRCKFGEWCHFAHIEKKNELQKVILENVNLIRNQQGGTNTLADRRLHINFYLAKISLRQRFLHQEHLSIDLIFFKYMMVDQKENLLPWFQLIKIG